MSNGRRFRTLLVALLAWGPALAEEAPGGGSSGSWTDPPARTVPNTPAAKTAGPAAPASARAERPAERPEAKTRRSAKIRREEIRRAASRPRTERHAEEARPMPRASRPSRPLAERAAPPRTVVRERQVALRPRRPQLVYGYADPEPVAFAYGRSDAGPLMEDGPDAWEGRAADLHARRVARARAAGYLVVRSRIYAFPDGTVVRRLSPLNGFDAED